MPEDNDQILDPAHDPETVVAGIPKPEKTEDKVVASEDGNQLERGGIKYIRAEALHQPARKPRSTKRR